VRHCNEQGRRIFVANVGVNASHRLVSPIAVDGSFTLVTIPEPMAGPNLIHYGEIPALRAVVPDRYWPVATHYDPEFETNTYGDNCGWAPRAAALRACRPGDCIVFIARLVGAVGPLFALVGLLDIEDILPDVSAPPDALAMRRFGANAHVRRAHWDGFWVFGGSPASRLFPKAVVVGREEAELLFRDRDGSAWNWRPGRTELQTIGSYTRSCRCVIDSAVDPARAVAFWELLRERVGCGPWP
jgi:hypothetical protein